MSDDKNSPAAVTASSTTEKVPAGPAGTNVSGSSTAPGATATIRVEPWPGPRHTIALIQGLYYLVTALWPMLSRDTFERITGPKTDWWLVMTVAAMAGVIGLVLTASGLRRRGSPESVLLGVGAAMAFMTIDVYYAWQRVISPVYLVDALLQLVFVGFWLSSWNRKRRS